jgi:hypothetical protein
VGINVGGWEEAAWDFHTRVPEISGRLEDCS